MNNDLTLHRLAADKVLCKWLDLDCQMPFDFLVILRVSFDNHLAS